MLTPVHLRDLLVEPGAHPRRQAHLSSASGLVRAGEWLYVVADDEHHLGSFKVGGAQADRTQLHRMLPGNLPLDKARRKQLKADLETLVLLPARAGRRQDVLLALGSGSRANREQGVVMDLDDHGSLAGESRTVNLAGLYLPLRSTFPDLNIEGAFVGNERFHLLQRGNKGDGRNASATRGADRWSPEGRGHRVGGRRAATDSDGLGRSGHSFAAAGTQQSGSNAASCAISVKTATAPAALRACGASCPSSGGL